MDNARDNRPTYRHPVRMLRDILAAAEQAFAAWAHRFVLQQHSPVDQGDGKAYCTNHWRPRVREWPCDAVVRETQRWDELQRDAR